MTGYKKGTCVVGYLDGGTWSAIFGMAYRDLLLHDLMGDGRIIREGGKELRVIAGTGTIPQSRNTVVCDFLDNTDGEWLWFVDSDMGFADDTVDRLIESADRKERPVMGGLCFAMQRKRDRGSFRGERFRIVPTLYEFLTVEDEQGFRPMEDYKRDEVQQVAGTGAACLLIHRDVLKRIEAKYGRTWFNTIEHPTADRGQARVFAEDLSFSLRCQAIGVPVHVNAAVKTTHDKKPWFLDEELYDQERVK